MPASDHIALEAWFHLSVGKEDVHAIHVTAPASTCDVPLDPTREIRRAGSADRDSAVALDDIIQISQACTPLLGHLAL